MVDEYVFIRGQGWVIAPSLEFSNANGRFRVVLRQPEPGEMYVTSVSTELEPIVRHCIACNWKKGINGWVSGRWIDCIVFTIEYLGPT